jgi:hypothetical protein
MDAIVATQIKPAEEPQIIESAKSALATSLSEENVFVEAIFGTPVVGNRGLELAIGKNHLGEEVKILKDEMAEMQNAIGELRSIVADLQEGSEGYKAIRNRFLSHFSKHKMSEDQTAQDYEKWIPEGDEAAHHGNCKYDAKLYSGKNARRDFSVYKALYGLSPGEVMLSVGK